MTPVATTQSEFDRLRYFEGAGRIALAPGRYWLNGQHVTLAERTIVEYTNNQGWRQVAASLFEEFA